MTDPISVPDLTHQEQGALNVLVKQWREKRPRNNLRAAFYDMKNSAQKLMSPQVPSVVRRRQFVLGWSAIAVDKLNRRCNLDGFYAADGTDLGSLGLAELIRRNRLTQEISQAGVSSLIHSVAFLVTTQGDTQAGEPPVLITTRDATTGTGVWDTRRRALSSFLSIAHFDDRGEPDEMVLYLPNLNVAITRSENGGWDVERREHRFGVPVDPMRYRPRIGREFGQSRITRAVMSIHTQALAAMIRADVNGEGYSLPRFVLLGATEEAFKNADGSPKAAWQAAWDAVWAVGDDPDLLESNSSLARADVKQFPGQSPEPQNAHLRMLAQMFSGETGIPIGELGIIGDANPTSADAYLAARDDIISEAEQTTDTWTPDVSSAVTRALRMLGDRVPDDLDVRPRWRSPMFLSRSVAADAGSKILAVDESLKGTQVGYELLGLTPDQITRVMAEKRRQRGAGVLDAIKTAAANANAG